jgi:hypothetical protein
MAFGMRALALVAGYCNLGHDYHGYRSSQIIGYAS